VQTTEIAVQLANMYIMHADTSVFDCFVGSITCQFTPAQPFWWVYTVSFNHEYLSNTAFRCCTQLAKMHDLESTDLLGSQQQSEGNRLRACAAPKVALSSLCKALTQYITTHCAAFIFAKASVIVSWLCALPVSFLPHAAVSGPGCPELHLGCIGRLQYAGMGKTQDWCVSLATAHAA